ncbi:hypothetical protein [Bradyrhizobium sp.]
MVVIHAIAGLGFTIAPLWQIASRLREAWWPKATPIIHDSDNWDG